SMTELLAELAVKPHRVWWVVLAAAAAIATGAIVWLVREPPPGMTCDCEGFTIDAPPGLRVIGWSPGAPLRTPLRVPASGATLQIPRGYHTIDYEAGGTVYSLAVASAGIGAARTIALPVPVTRAGYVFVPGGDVPIGDLARDGTRDERPVTTV